MNNKINILWIPAFAPYKGVKHAGGKTILLYTSMLAKESDIDFTLLTMCHADEIEKVKNSYSETNAHIRIIEQWDTGFKKFVRKTWNIESGVNPYNRNAGLLDNWTEYFFLREMRLMKKEGYKPDIVALHFTQVVLLADNIKKIFPQCKIVAVEEDVAYLGYERRISTAKGWYDTFVAKLRAQRLKKKEVGILNRVDLIITNNTKDTKLLQMENIPTKIIMFSVYYQSFIDVPRRYNGNHDILFYGAMNREENWKSVVWFAENVLPKLKDADVKLKVIGGNPNPAVLNYQSSQLEILGYVDDISELFSTSLCLVAPLVLGAGIKVKILEGMSAGIPVLTNEIGIEGIPATNRQHYYHCETPEDYETVIRKLIDGREDLSTIEKGGKELITSTFNYKETYKTVLKELWLLKNK